MSQKSFQLEIVLDHATKGEVWDMFFNQINRWWSKELHTSEKTKKIIIQTFIGGKMYEDFGEGEGLVWAEVIGVDYPNSLHLKGNLSAAFGGPAILFDRFAFDEQDEDIKLTFNSDIIGEISDQSIQSLKKGWQSIFNDYFVPFCQK